MPFRLRQGITLSITSIIPLFLFATSIEGDIAVGGSYNTNAGLLSSDELAEMGISKRANSAFGFDADVLLSLCLADQFSLDYNLFASVTPTDISTSFFTHSLAFTISHELDEVDLEYGIEAGHLLLGFENRTVDPQAFFNFFWYATDSLSYYLTATVSYVVGLSAAYDYFTAPGLRFENGIYLYPVTGNGSFISFGAGERLFFFGEEYVAPFEPDDPPVWSHHGFSETYARLKGKFVYEGFSIEASLRYGFFYYLADDRWMMRGTTYEKRRIDHAIRPKAAIEYRFTDLFSLLGYYQYLWNFSSIGTERSDYRDLSYDQHLAGIMARFVF